MLRPGDIKAPRALGALLIDLDRPAQALRFLQSARADHPDDVETLADLVRVHLLLGERDKALAMLDAFNRGAGTAIPPRQRLADILYQSGEYDIARSLYEQILKVDPQNLFAQLGTARVAVQKFEPGLARRLLAAITPDGPVARIYWLTRAEYHQLVGEYTEAKEIYGKFLATNAADHEARLALAKLQAYV